MFIVFFFNGTETTETYTSVHTLPLHDALPISSPTHRRRRIRAGAACSGWRSRLIWRCFWARSSRVSLRDRDRCRRTHSISWALPPITRSVSRSEEHTSELQSPMRHSYAVLCLYTNNYNTHNHIHRVQKH